MMVYFHSYLFQQQIYVKKCSSEIMFFMGIVFLDCINHFFDTFHDFIFLN